MRKDEAHFWMDGTTHCAAFQAKPREQSSLEYCNSDCSQDSLPILSSLPVSPSVPNVSKASSFLEYSQLGRLSVGWQDSPDIVALFLAGQLEKYEASVGNISFFDNNHEALFKPPEFEMRTSFLLMNDKSLPVLCTCAQVFVSENKSSHVVTESSKNHFNTSFSCLKCRKLSLAELRQTLEKLHIDVKMSSVENITQHVQEVVDGMDIENSYLGDNSQCSQMEGGIDVGGNSCANVSEYSNAIVTASNTIHAPVKQNLFSTTIISAPEIADSSTQLPFSPLSHELDSDAKPKISCKETGFDIDSPSSLHTASTPSKASKSNYSKGACQQQHFTPTPQSSSGRYERSSNAEKCDPIDKFPFVDQSTINPFDSCTDSLQMPTVSPSLFKEVISPHSMSERSTDFRWSIEQMALLNPAHIELTSPQNYCDSPHDLEYERRAQEAIEKFFSRRCILPSPWTNSVPKSRFTDQSDRCKYSIIPNSLHTPRSVDSRSGGQQFMSPSFSKHSVKYHSGVSVACQTNLSYPAVLPPHVESLLSLHSQSTNVNTSDTENEDLSTLGNTSLRRRLLFSSEEATSSSPSLKSSLKTSPKNFSEVVSCGSHSPTAECVENNISNQTEPTLDSTVVPAMSTQKSSSVTSCFELRSISPIDGNFPQSPVHFELGLKEKNLSLKEVSHYGPLCSLSPTDYNELGDLFLNRNPVLPSSPNLSPIKFNSPSRQFLCPDCEKRDCWCKNDKRPSCESGSCQLSCEDANDSDAVSTSKQNISKFVTEEMTNSTTCDPDIYTLSDIPYKVPSLVTAEMSSFSPAVVSSLNYDRSSPISHPSNLDFKYPMTHIDESLMLLSSKSSEITFLTASSAESCFVPPSQCPDIKSCSGAAIHSSLVASQGSTEEFHSLESTTISAGTDELHLGPDRCVESPAASPSSLCVPSNDAEVSVENTTNVS